MPVAVSECKLIEFFLENLVWWVWYKKEPSCVIIIITHHYGMFAFAIFKLIEFSNTATHSEYCTFKAGSKCVAFSYVASHHSFE